MRRAHDVAIYTPFAASHYVEGGPSAGGAELQTVYLARRLLARGTRVAHIVWPLKGPVGDGPMPTLIEREPYQADRGRFGRLAEVRSIWRAMRAADARAYVFRTGRTHLFIAAAFCLLHRRRLVFSGANDLDFTDEYLGRVHRGLYRAALRRTDAIVTQSAHQQMLARRFAPRRARVPIISSFVEPAEARQIQPDGFIWIGRLVDYKRPLAYLEMAAALPELRFRMIYLLDFDTPGGLPDEVKRRADELANVELMYKLPRSDALDLIARSYAVVSTSRFEGMPNVFLEAWSRGVPVASLDWDAGGRIGEKGLGLVAGGSLDRLRQQLQTLADDKELRDELGGNAREFVRAEHHPDVVAARWADLLDELLQGQL